MAKELRVGLKAPAFTLPGTGGTVRLSGLKGKRVVLYFYPKDDTPGCTNEAKDFTALAKDFKKAGAVILGVSKDSLVRHEKFREKYGLPFDLLSDEDGKVIGKYGSWVEKKLYGRTYMGIERSTFLIDDKGILRGIWRKVKVKGHAAEVLEALGSL